MGCFFVFSSCGNDKKDVDALFVKKAAVEEARNVESYLSQAGIVKAKLTSPYMLRVQAQSQVDSPYMEFPRTLHVDFYDDSTVIESTLDAKYAKYVEFNHKVLLRDSVLVQSIKNGDTLRTQELWWDEDKQEVRSVKGSFYADINGRLAELSRALGKAEQDALDRGAWHKGQ
jgi:hypothetical protein